MCFPGETTSKYPLYPSAQYFSVSGVAGADLAVIHFDRYCSDFFLIGALFRVHCVSNAAFLTFAALRAGFIISRFYLIFYFLVFWDASFVSFLFLILYFYFITTSSFCTLPKL